MALILPSAAFTIKVYQIRPTKPAQRGIEIPGLTVSHDQGGTIELNCSRNVRLGEKYLYVQTNIGLVRYDLSCLDEVTDEKLEEAVRSLKKEMVVPAEPHRIHDYFVTDKSIVVASSKNLHVVARNSLKTLSQVEEAFGTIAGNEAIIFGARENTFAVYSIWKRKRELRKESEITRPDLSKTRRCLHLCAFRKVTFVMSVQERGISIGSEGFSKVGVAIFSAFKYKIRFVTFYSLAHLNMYRLLGYFFDERKEEITILTESDKSVSLKLSN